jgi:putative membrane protein
MRLRRKKRDNPLLGLAAGLVGGLAGSLVMAQFHRLWAKMTGSGLEEKVMDSTVKAASAVSEGVMEHPLAEHEKPKAGAAVHFGFGGSMGALYGMSAAMSPKVRTAAGMPFGAGLYVAAHGAALPALGLSNPVTQQPLVDEVGVFVGHLVYGVVTDVTRRGVIAAVRAM